MATIPTFEENLLNIHMCLGLLRPASKYKDSFIQGEQSQEDHENMAKELLSEICIALEVEGQTKKDLEVNLFEFAGFNKDLASRVWTVDANQQQIIWHMLAYSYVPYMARRLAFWSLHGVEQGKSFDAGMPGGQFWFLPDVNQDQNQLILPVSQVVNWLFDLFGSVAKEQALAGLEDQEAQKNSAHILRTLQAWRIEGRTPKSAKKIEELFPDDAQLEFKGVFELPEDLSLKMQLEQAINFIQSRQLNDKKLNDQIPMIQADIANVLAGEASVEDTTRFIKQLKQRYAKPSMRLIRQRLRVARMAQTGYEALIEFLCPNLDRLCTNYHENKILQLVAQFHTIYNLTIDAYKAEPSSFTMQDAWFESRLAPWDKADLLLSVIPSLKGRSVNLLANRLTYKFMNMSCDTPIGDLIPWDDPIVGKDIIAQRVESLISEAKVAEGTIKLGDRIRAGSPWRALKAESNFNVVSQIASNPSFSYYLREMACKRMRELTDEPARLSSIIGLEAFLLLDSERQDRPADAKACVDTLLAEGFALNSSDIWLPLLLKNKAKHLLMQNEFSAAQQTFLEALEMCEKRNYGDLIGEIARDYFALSVAMKLPVDKKVQQKCYRTMLDLNMLNGGMPAFSLFTGMVYSFEQIQKAVEDYFWDDLYVTHKKHHRIQRESRAIV